MRPPFTADHMFGTLLDEADEATRRNPRAVEELWRGAEHAVRMNALVTELADGRWAAPRRVLLREGTVPDWAVGCPPSVVLAEHRAAYGRHTASADDAMDGAVVATLNWVLAHERAPLTSRPAPACRPAVYAEACAARAVLVGATVEETYRQAGVTPPDGLVLLPPLVPDEEWAAGVETTCLWLLGVIRSLHDPAAIQR